MPKSKPKRRSELRPTNNKAARQGRVEQSAATKNAKIKDVKRRRTDQQHQSLSEQHEHRDSKQARIIAMLQTPSGATIEAIMRVAGWQQHSVRGFLAGVVRKKLGLNLISAAAEDGRIYRIVDDATLPSTDAKVLRAA